jgi:hypothetical protein
MDGNTLSRLPSCTRLGSGSLRLQHVHGTPLSLRCSAQTNNTHKTTHSHITMVLEAGYPSTTGFRKVVKATILVRKKPGMSDEAFIEHYNHVHAQMAAPILQKHNVITYSLVGYAILALF